MHFEYHGNKLFGLVSILEHGGTCKIRGHGGGHIKNSLQSVLETGRIRLGGRQLRLLSSAQCHQLRMLCNNPIVNNFGAVAPLAGALSRSLVLRRLIIPLGPVMCGRWGGRQL